MMGKYENILPDLSVNRKLLNKSPLDTVLVLLMTDGERSGTQGEKTLCINLYMDAEACRQNVVFVTSQRQSGSKPKSATVLV